MSGILTLVFDDGYTHIYEDVVPLLDKNDLPGVFAIPLERQAVAASESLATTTWQAWLPLAARGHEVAAHGISHVDLTTFNDNELHRELREPQEKLQATTLVYPGGSYNDRVVTAAKEIYQAARTVHTGFEQLPPRDPFTLHTINYSQRNWSLYKANLRVWWAKLTNKWLIETYHVVSDESQATHYVPLAEFKRHLAFVKRSGISVKTIRAALQNP